MRTGNLVVSGSNSCTARASLAASLQGILTINSAKFELTTSSNTITRDVSITGGTLLADNINLSRSSIATSNAGTLKETSNGLLSVVCNSPPCALNLYSSSNVKLNLDSSYGNGVVNVNNASPVITFGGGSEMLTNSAWSFDRCQKIDLNKNWRTMATVTLGNGASCPLNILSGDLDIQNTFNANSDITVSGTNSDITSTGTINLSSQLRFTNSVTGGKLDAIIVLASGTIQLDGGSGNNLKDISGTGDLNVNVQSTFDKINLHSGSLILVTSAISCVSSSSTLTLLSSSAINITSTSAITLSGTVSLNSAEFVYAPSTSAGTITIASMSVTSSTLKIGSGTATINSITATNPTIIQTGGSLILKAQKITGGSISSAGTSLQLESISIESINTFTHSTGLFITAASPAITKLVSSTLSSTSSGKATVNQLDLSSSSTATFKNCASGSSFVFSATDSDVSIQCNSQLLGATLTNSDLDTTATITFPSSKIITQNSGNINISGFFGASGNIYQNSGIVNIQTGGELQLSGNNFPTANGKLNINGGKLTINGLFSPGPSQLIGSDGVLNIPKSGTLAIGSSTLVDLSSVDFTFAEGDEITWADATSSRINLRNAIVTTTKTPVSLGQLDLGGSTVNGKAIEFTRDESALYFTGGAATVNVDINSKTNNAYIYLDSATVQFNSKVSLKRGYWLWWPTKQYNWDSKSSIITVNGDIDFKEDNYAHFSQDTINLTEKNTFAVYDWTDTIIYKSSIRNVTAKYEKITLYDFASITLVSCPVVISTAYFESKSKWANLYMGGTTEISDTQTFDMEDPCVTLRGGTIDGEEQLLKVLESGEVIITGCVDLIEDAKIKSDGTISIQGGSLSSNSSSVYIYSGTITLDGESLSFFNQSYLLIQGTAGVTDNSIVEFKETSTFVLDDGANFQTEGDNVTLSFVDSTLEGNGGFMQLNGSTSWSVDQSLVHFNVTTLELRDNSVLTAAYSTLQFETATGLYNYAKIILDHTLMDISSTLTSSFSVTIDATPNSEIMCTGQLLLQDTDVIIDNSSKISIVNSGYISLTNSTFDLGTDSTLVVTSGTFVNGDGGIVTISSSSHVQMSDAIFNLNKNSKFDLYADVDIITSVVTLNGGKLNLNGASVNLQDASSLIVDYAGTVNMNSNAILTIDGTFSVSNFGSIVADSSEIYVNSVADINSSGKLDLRSDSTISINNDFNAVDSIVYLDGSTIQFSPSVSKEYNFQNGTLSFIDSDVLLNIGEMLLNSGTIATFTDTTVTISGKLTVQGSETDFVGGNIDLINGDILVQTLSNASFTGASLTSDSLSSMELRDSAIVVSGSSDLAINNLFSLSSTFDVSQSNISLYNSGTWEKSTSYFDTNSFFTIESGTTTFSDASKCTLVLSSLKVNSVLSFIDDTNLNITTATVSITNGASFLIEDPAKLVSSTGTYEIEGVFKSFGANLDFTIANEIDITAGGRFETYNSTECYFFKSFIYIDNGSVAIYNDSILNFDANSYVEITAGDFSSYDDSIISLLTSTTYIQIIGTLNAYDHSKYNLNDAYLVINGTGSFYNHSELNLLTSIATFSIDGALIFTDNSVLSLYSGNSIVVQNSGTAGLLDFHGDVDNSWDNVTLNVEGELAIYERASISITRSSLFISGIFFTDGDLHFQTSESNFILNGLSPHAYINGTLLSTHSFTNCNVTIFAGTLELLGYTTSLFDHSQIIINLGSFTSSFYSAPSFKDSSITVTASNNVGLTFEMNSKPYFSKTSVFVDGVVSFTDNEESQFYSSLLSVTGAVTFSVNASNEFYYSNLTVNSPLPDGGVYFQNNSTSSFSDGVITLSKGAIRTLDSAYISALSTSITIDEGDMLLYSYSKLELLDQYCPIVINTGNLLLYENSKLITFPGTVITIFSGSFAAYNDVILNFVKVSIDIKTGTFDLHNYSQLTLTDSEVSVSGSFNLFDESHLNMLTSQVYIKGDLRTFSQISLVAEDTLFFVTGQVSFSGTNTSVHSFASCGIEVFGDVVFVDSIDPEFTVNTYIVIQGGSFQIFDDVVATVDNSTLTLVDSANGIFGLYNTSSISFTLSPIKMYGGNIVLKDYSDFYFDADSPIKVFGGDFLIQDHADVFATPFCSIEVQKGNFVVSNYVDIDFEFITIDVAGNFETHNSTSLYFHSSAINVAPGTFESAEYAKLVLDNTTLSVESGKFQVSDHTDFSSVSSTVIVTTNGKAKNKVGGQFLSYGDSKLAFEDSTLIVDGEFTTYDKSAFTISDSSLTVLNGTFSTRITSTFNAVSTHINVTGAFLLSDNSIFSSTNSVLDVLGTFLTNEASIITISFSDATISNGNFETQNATEFSMDNSNLIVQGDATFRGNSSSVHTFSENSILVQSGNLTITEYTTPTFTNSITRVIGGYHNQFMSSENYYSNSSLTVDGVGTLVMLGNSYWALENQSLAELVSDGASAIFCDNSLFEVKSDSTFNVTNGQITLCSHAKLNLYPNTHFNLVDGSFYLRDSATMVAYQGTSGTINGGNMYVMDQASLIFVDSKLKVQGAINHNSTIPIRILSDSSIVIDGSPVVISGGGVLKVYDGAYLSVLDNSLILRDQALIDANRGNILISGGNILAYDYSKVSAVNETNILVDGGNITTNDNSEFYAADHSLITVSTTAISKGFVYVQGSSVMTLTEETILNVNLGSVSVRNDGKLIAQDSSQINISGDILFEDYSSFTMLSSSSLSVTNGGNFIASGVGSTLFISESDVNIDSGDMFFSYRTSLKSENSNFSVMNGGTLIVTDLSFVTFERSTVSVTGGGDLLLQRQSYLTAIDTSITVDNNGNALFTESSSLSLQDSAILTVQNGGSIVFQNTSRLSSSENSQCIVVGGGSIYFSDNALADLKTGASLTVKSGGDIIFSETSGIDLQSNSFLNVTGGDIQFNDGSTISCDSSSLIVENGNIVLSGTDSRSAINNNSNFIVTNGRIEFRGYRIVIFNHSNMNVLGGDLVTYDYTQFIFINQSTALIDGGNFISADYSKVNMDNSNFMVTKGSVIFQNYGEISLSTSTISVTNDELLGQSGSIDVTDFVILSMEYSSLEVTGGDFNLDAKATISSLNSKIETSSGSALFSGESSYTGLFSSVEVSGGNLSIFGNSFWNFTSSTAEVTDGNLNIYEDTFTTLVHSSFSVSNGNCDVYDSSTFWMNESSLTVTGGDLTYRNEAQFQGNFSTITVRGGKLVYDDTSTTSLFGSTVIVNLSAKRANNGVDILIYQGESDFYSSSTSITVSAGNMHFTDLATSYLENTKVTINGGNLIHSSSTIVVFDAAEVLITSGSLQIIGSSTSTVKNFSSITVDGGDLILSDSPNLSVTQSVITVISGTSSFNGGISNFQQSILNVTSNGNINFGGSSSSQFSQSVISLSGNGIFSVSGSSKLQVLDSSTITIFGGSFTTTDYSNFVVEGSNYYINGGTTTFTGSSTADIISSLFVISAGDIIYTGSSVVTIHSGSNYQVTGGNIITSGTSVLSIDQSCFTLNSGSVSYSGSSSVTLATSCWNVNGGDVNFSGNTNYNLLAQSNLTLSDGNFITSESAKIQIDHSSVFLYGGSFSTLQNSNTKIESSGILIEHGTASWNDDSNFNIHLSTFTVKGGEVQFNDRSKTFWAQSTLSVNNGNMILNDYTDSQFVDTSLFVSGSVQFKGFSRANFEGGSLSITIGSLNFLDYTECSFHNSVISIFAGNLQYVGHSNLTIADSTITIKGGKFEFLNDAEVVFSNSDISLIDGSVDVKDQVNVQINDCSLEILGDFYTQNSAELSILDTDVTIEGSLQLVDTGAFFASNSNFDINSGNLVVVNNDVSTRKEVTFIQSTVNVRSSANQLNGNIKVEGNADLTLLSSEFTIDGDLSLSGNSVLYVHQSSSFVIPTGVVTMDQDSSISISEDSIFSNMGTVFTPGTISFSSGAAVSNSGYMQSDHNLNINCGANGPAFKNSGSLFFNQNPLSCVDNLEHKGLMQISGSNVTLQTYTNDRSSTVVLSESTIHMSLSNLYESNGSFGGRGIVQGNFQNRPGATIMSSGEFGVTSLRVTEDFQSSGTVFFMINSRDLTDPDSYSVINADRSVDLQGGRVCVCFSPYLELIDGDKWDLIQAQSLLQGKFDQVDFGCQECPVRTRSVQSTEATCEPNADYGTRSFSVLFESCGGSSGSNFLTNITPPYYVIIPVAVGIILLVTIFFGGALLMDERMRRRKATQKAKLRRKNLVKELQQSSSHAVSSSHSSTG